MFKRLLLKDETIGVIPQHGYNPQDVESKKAIHWIKFVAETENISIRHARNFGEVKVGKYKLDGCYENETGKVALEFHGCLWHGCPKCYARDTKNPVNGLSMAELYEKTLDKEHYLKKQGFTIITKWECDFDREATSNSFLMAFISQQDMVSPLRPRDAFFGGRTVAFTLFKEASSDEAIKYYDVTSLYPFINKTGKYAVGHPEIITENFEDLECYEGIVKCKVLAPHKLLIPVLPCKMNGKLLFPLCRTCAETQHQDDCRHSNDERAFIGTWVTDELKKAVQKGYVLEKMYEVWHYTRVEQYDPETKTGGLFTGYVNKFLKVLFKQDSY